jgi:hypothetical protein
MERPMRHIPIGKTRTGCQSTQRYAPWLVEQLVEDSADDDAMLSPRNRSDPCLR